MKVKRPSIHQALASVADRYTDWRDPESVYLHALRHACADMLDKLVRARARRAK